MSLSLKRTLVGGRRFRPNVAAVSGRRFRLNFGHLEFMYFGEQQPSELSVDDWNLLSSANKFSFVLVLSYQRARSHVLLLLWTTTSLHTKGVHHKSRKDFVQTGGVTFGDTVTHFCDSFQCSLMLRNVEHLFLLVSSIFLRGSGKVS